MDDLIDRQKIKARFEPWLNVKGYSEGELNMLKAVLYEITIMPSAERHGHWIYTPTSPLGYTCSECGKTMCYFNYCPHCGARMELE